MARLSRSTMARARGPGSSLVMSSGPWGLGLLVAIKEWPPDGGKRLSPRSFSPEARPETSRGPPKWRAATGPFKRSSLRSLDRLACDVGPLEHNAAGPRLGPRVGVLLEAELAEHLADRDLHLRAVEQPDRNRRPVELPSRPGEVGDVEPHRLALGPVGGAANLLLQTLAEIQRVQLGLGR